LHEIFAEARRNAFWVVVIGEAVVGSFGIESRAPDTTELRRMYLDAHQRRRGIAQGMLDHAEAPARELGFTKLMLSTAEIQKAAIKFYAKSGVGTETAELMSTKTVGGGLKRFHFAKDL
jgi:putative acetyltransferase